MPWHGNAVTAVPRGLPGDPVSVWAALLADDAPGAPPLCHRLLHLAVALRFQFCRSDGTGNRIGYLVTLP
jgi:hypothetical protein